ncbi:hypothetical protein FOL46_001896, partial [Perkinsus olseni]
MVATSSGLPYYRYIRIPGQERYVQASVVKKDEVHNGLFVLVDVLLGPAASSLLGDKVSHHEINGHHYLGAWIPANFKSVWRLSDETVPGGPERVLKSLSPPLEAGDLPNGIEVPELEDTLHMAEAVIQTADNDLDGTVPHQPATTQASIDPARAAAVPSIPVSHVQGPQASGPTSQESTQLPDSGSAAAVVDGAAIRGQGFGSYQLAVNGQVPSAIGQSTLGLAPMPNGIPGYASTFSAPYRQSPSPAVSIVPSQSGYSFPYGQAPGAAFPELNQNGIMVRPPAQVQGPYSPLPPTPFLGCGYPTNMGYANNVHSSIAPLYTLGQLGGLQSCNPSIPGLHPGQPPVGVPSGVSHYNSLPGAGTANEKCLNMQEVRNIQKQANGTPLIMGGPYRGAEDVRPLILVRSRIQENISGDEVFAYYYIRRSIEADIIEGFSLPHPAPYRSSYAYLVGLLWSSLEGKMDPDAELSKVMDDWNGLTMSQGEDFSKFLKRFEAGLRSLSAVGNPMTPELAKQSLLTKVVPALRDFARTFQLDSYQRLTCRMLLEDRQRRRKLAVSGRGRQEDDRGMILMSRTIRTAPLLLNSQMIYEFVLFLDTGVLPLEGAPRHWGGPLLHLNRK